jgi:hypothetical protein
VDRDDRILNSIVWDIEPGALVKIKKYDFSGIPYFNYGVVIGKKEIDQLEMFPYVEVYTFETQTITRQSPSTMEILSRASNEEVEEIMD